jgi:hypothetical protein
MGSDSTPETWTDETTPFDVVRYYAEKHVTDEQIRLLLDLKGINSLAILEDSILKLSSVLHEDNGRPLTRSVTAALKRSKNEPIKILGGQLDFDATCISKKVLNLFAADAVSYISSKPGSDNEVIEDEPPNDDNRYPSFTLVMGPSGSGKTMFSLNLLPRMVFSNNAESHQEMFRVHRTVENVIKEMSTAIDLPTLLADEVQAIVARKLANYDYDKTARLSIDLALFVILDEAGGSEYKDFFNKASKIQNLVEALEQMQHFTFTKGVHVTLTGTALETITQKISSKVETFKFRMQPWKEKHFRALLANVKRIDRENVVKFVERFSILASLRTNARCAYFLALSVPSLNSVKEEQWVDLVEACVSDVARGYIGSNCLSYLQHLKDKFKAVQEVFRAVNKAMINAKVVKFPNFDHITDKVLRTATQSLLEVNVEFNNNKVVLIPNAKYSVSVTPAISIVLAELLCQNARINWNWQGCEATAAMGEWKKMITEIKGKNFSSSCGITYLRTPVPAGGAKVRFTLPLVGSSSVVLNGPMAPYADVIAPFRLVQAKFSAKPKAHLIVDFDTEMGKMGLTDDPNFRLQQAVTSVLYLMWPERRTIAGGKFASFGCGKDEECKDKADEEAYEETRGEHYPYQTLLSGYTPLFTTASFILDDQRLYVLADDNDVEATNLITKRQIKVMEDFTSQRVTAVFVTNAESLILKKEKDQSDVNNVEPAAKGMERAEENLSQDAVNEGEPTSRTRGRAKRNQSPDHGGFAARKAGQATMEQCQSANIEGAKRRKRQSQRSVNEGKPPAARTRELAIPSRPPAAKRSGRAKKDQSPRRKNGPVDERQQLPVREYHPLITIGKKDVDRQGVLKKPLPDYLTSNFRKNVEVRFLFY